MAGIATGFWQVPDSMIFAFGKTTLAYLAEARLGPWARQGPCPGCTSSQVLPFLQNGCRSSRISPILANFGFKRRLAEATEASSAACYFKHYANLFTLDCSRMGWVQLPLCPRRHLGWGFAKGHGEGVCSNGNRLSVNGTGNRNQA